MSDHDNSSKHKTRGAPDPASLYRLYRASRRAAPEPTRHQSTQLAGDTSAEDNDMSTNTTADIVYRSYRESRVADHSQAIDSILHEINLEQSRDQVLRQIEQETPITSDAGLDSNGVDSVGVGGAGLGSTLGKVFSLPAKLLGIASDQSGDAANDDKTSIFKGVVPLAAAAMLALVVVPFLVMNTQDQSGTAGSYEQLASVSQVPESLFQLSGEAVNLVGPMSSGTVGFSADVSPSAEFMNLGAAVTDLVVAYTAKSSEYQQQTKAGLERILANQQVDSVSAEISALINELNSPSGERGQLAMVLGALNDSILRQHSADGLSDWYSLGQSLEALNLSAGLIIEGQDGVPLQEALKNHKALFPQEAQFGDDPRVNSLLQEVRMVSEAEADLLDSARKIDVAVDKINLLVD